MADADQQQRLELARYNALAAAQLESHKTTIRFADNALRAVFLMNGGALIALLSFLGSRAGQDVGDYARAVLCASYFFIGGLVCVTLAYGAGYLTQSSYTRCTAEGRGATMAGKALNVFSVLFWLGSLACFSCGTARTLEAFAKLASHAPHA